MSNLLSLLHLGSSGVAAQNAGVATATNNVANINTKGYSRQRLDLESMIGPPGGVRSGANTRVASALLSSRIWNAAGSVGRSQTMSAALADLETTLASGASISDRLATTFSRLEQVAAAPTDPNLRGAVVSSLRDLVSTIHQTAATVASARTSTDQQITDVAKRATSLAGQLAAANRVVRTSGDPAAADRRDALAGELAGLVGGEARIDPDGQMRFVLDGGAVLVDGDRAAALATSPDPVTGLAKLEVVDGAARRDVTAAVSGGQLGGHLAVRDQLVKLGETYDRYAVDLAAAFDAVSTANAGLDGVSGRAIFAPVGAVAGAASRLAIDPALLADPTRLATAAAGAPPGDNTGARALADLATRTVASGGTRSLLDASLDASSGLAHTIATAKSDAASDELVDAHLGDLRDSLSGVDLQEESTNLVQFQNASAALTKFIATINDMLSQLITQL